MDGTDLDASISPIGLRSLGIKPAISMLGHTTRGKIIGRLALCCLGSRTPLFASNKERMYMAWPLQRAMHRPIQCEFQRASIKRPVMNNQLVMLTLDMLAPYITYDTVCLVDMTWGQLRLDNRES